MKKSTILLFAIFVGLGACKQQKIAKNTTSTPIIATVGDQAIPSSEFAYVYHKNNANTPEAYTQESINEYLKLYLNFRLKVREAEALGLDTGKAFQKELEGYKKQLAQPYFTEKNVTDKLTKEAYERMKEEVNASHILIRVSPEADPADTLAAFNKIMDIRHKISQGEPFEKLAQQFSEDPSAKSNNGYLGYFTAFGTIYPFESAAYNTPVGTVSNPVRTQFGYHLVKVNNKRKSQGQVKVAHIMIRYTNEQSSSDSVAAREKIYEIYNRLQKGDSWNNLVSQFSEDANSKNKGGELIWVSAGKMIPSFEEAAFALQTPGEISQPVLTPYGWHIIKLLERKELESFETLEPTIKTKVAKDRGEINKKALVERLKKENAFTENSQAVEAAVSAASAALISGSWPGDDAKSNPVLFSIGENKYFQNDFFKYVKEKQKSKKNTLSTQGVRNLYKDYSEESLIAYEEAHLEEKYPDYRMLVKEYRDGILLFQLMDDNVWSKAIEDTAGLKKFFNDNKENYKWDYRAHTKIFNIADQATLEKVKVELAKNKFPVKDYTIKELSFASKKYDLNDGDKKTLDAVFNDLNKHKQYVAELTASADHTEGIQIATQRAQSTKDYLVSLGIDASRIVAVTQVAKGKKASPGDRKLSVRMFTTSAKELEKYFNEKAPLALQVSEGIYQKGENEFLNQVEWQPGEYASSSGGRIQYVVISKIEEPRLKAFEEVRGLIISDYQSFLEKEWIENLRKKYPVTIHEEEVKKITKP